MSKMLSNPYIQLLEDNEPSLSSAPTHRFLHISKDRINLSGKKSSLVKDKIQTITETSNIIYYREEYNGKLVKRKLDFDSPHTKEAAAQSGVTFEDCILK